MTKQLTTKSKTLDDNVSKYEAIASRLQNTEAEINSVTKEKEHILCTYSNLQKELEAHTVELANVKEIARVKEDQIFLLNQTSASTQATNVILQAKLEIAISDKDTAAENSYDL